MYSSTLNLQPQLRTGKTIRSFINKLMQFTTALMLVSFSFFSSHVSAQTTTPTLTTDYPDYPPGATVTLTGTGFAPGEDITMRVIHVGDPLDNDTSSAHLPWTIQADADGNFTTTWD